MKMPIKIFIDYISQPARAVYALALLGKFPHEIIETRVNRKEVKYLSFSICKNSMGGLTR